MGTFHTCDRCCVVMHDEGEDKRAYKIIHPSLDHMCDRCYTDIVKFIEQTLPTPDSRKAYLEVKNPRHKLTKPKFRYAHRS